jgi:hypothetical protein
LDAARRSKKNESLGDTNLNMKTRAVKVCSTNKNTGATRYGSATIAAGPCAPRRARTVLHARIA